MDGEIMIDPEIFRPYSNIIYAISILVIGIVTTWMYEYHILKW
jgi:hypothetical protein